jgi:type I restriction enzyme M protein
MAHLSLNACRKPLGEKRKMLSEEHIAELTRIYGNFVEGEYCKIFDEDDLRLTGKVTGRASTPSYFQASPNVLSAFASRKRLPPCHESQAKTEEIAREVAEGQKNARSIIDAISTLDSTKLS